jgi:hypothetical protein
MQGTEAESTRIHIYRNDTSSLQPGGETFFECRKVKPYLRFVKLHEYEVESGGIAPLVTFAPRLPYPQRKLPQ